MEANIHELELGGASLLSQWFVTYFVVGRTPSSGFSNTLKAKADDGVGRGHCA